MGLLGADADARSSDGGAAAMAAARNGSVECLMLLMEAGCGIEARRADGLSALDLAS